MHHFRCQCGQVQGQIETQGVSNRVVCYCSDCQAFAHYLKQPDAILDKQGGTEVLQVAQPRVEFTQGEEHLAIMRLSPNGLLRWYTACCNTPVCNTMSNHKLAFVGFVHSVLNKVTLDGDFGPGKAVVNTAGAYGKPLPKSRGLIASLVKILAIVGRFRFNGGYQASPFFNDQGEPEVKPKAITKEESLALKAVVRAKQER